MTTVILGDLPEVDALLERRRALGQDHRDEVWEGVYYVVPSASIPHSRLQVSISRLLEDAGQPLGLIATAEINVGKKDDLRVPGAALLRGDADGVYAATAAVVVEVLSPHDTTPQKFGFYAARGVEEIWVADLDTRTVRIWELRDGEYTETGRSGVLSLTQQDVESRIRWP